MLCPNCGIECTTKHKFCRNCGMNLEPVSKALAAHRALTGEGGTPGAGGDDERRALRRMTNGLLFGVAIILAGLLLLSAGKFFALRPSYRMFGVIVMVLGVFLSLLSVLSPLRAGVGLLRRGSRPDALEGGRPTGRLSVGAAPEPVPSVTERTTDLLGIGRATPSPRQD